MSLGLYPATVICLTILRGQATDKPNVELDDNNFGTQAPLLDEHLHAKEATIKSEHAD